MDCLASMEAPPIRPVYNGSKLDIHPKIVGNALSSISLKHYYGSCKRPVEQIIPTDYGYNDAAETLHDEIEDSCHTSEQSSDPCEGILSDEFEYREDSRESFRDLKPECCRENLRCRNTFWNIHQPDLLKLTWPQQYVSTATVTEFMHDHLIDQHGALCAEFHKEEDRAIFLEKELLDYDRLRVIKEPKRKKKRWCRKRSRERFPVCKRFAKVGGDDDIDPNFSIKQSKAECCITIGKRARQEPSVTELVSPLVLQSCIGEGEGDGYWETCSYHIDEGEYEVYPDISYDGEFYAEEICNSSTASSESIITNKKLKKLRKIMLQEELNRPPKLFHVCD